VHWCSPGRQKKKKKKTIEENSFWLIGGKCIREFRGGCREVGLQMQASTSRKALLAGKVTQVEWLLTSARP
jgi:hypothetical protein